MKKPIVLLVSLLALTACTKNEQAEIIKKEVSDSDIKEAEVSDNIKTSEEYFTGYSSTKLYEGNNGYVACFDDGTDYGFALVFQMSESLYELVNDSNEVIDALLKTDDFKYIDLNSLAPDMSSFEKYIGQPIKDMISDGFSLSGYSSSNGKCESLILRSRSTLTTEQMMAAQNGDVPDTSYEVNVFTEEPLNEDDFKSSVISSDLQESLTVKSIIPAIKFDNDFYQSLLDSFADEDTITTEKEDATSKYIGQSIQVMFDDEYSYQTASVNLEDGQIFSVRVEDTITHEMYEIYPKDDVYSEYFVKDQLPEIPSTFIVGKITSASN